MCPHCSPTTPHAEQEVYDQRFNNRIIGSNPDLEGEGFEALQHLTRVQLMAEVRAAQDDELELNSPLVGPQNGPEEAPRGCHAYQFVDDCTFVLWAKRKGIMSDEPSKLAHRQCYSRQMGPDH